MGLALDEPRNTDDSFESDGLQFVVDGTERGDVMRYGGIQVDHRTGWWGSSFVVTPQVGACC
jgi:Fe-S cluster assembly iron-binding protein IscA